MNGRRLVMVAALPAALVAMIAMRGVATPRPSDYDAELARFSSADLRNRYLRATLTGDFGDYRLAEQALERELAASGASQALLLARATLAFKLHRLPKAKRDLALLPETDAVRALRADVALMEGRYADAARAYESLAATSPSWDNLARLAYFKSKTGDVAGADRLYAAAQDELTAKELRSYAWVEVQRGVMRFEHGRYAGALAHYERAERAYSGWWLVEEHRAEVLHGMGRTRQAVALYRKVVARTRNPELFGALAAILEDEQPEEARALYAEAGRLFAEQMRIYPEAAIGHALRFQLSRADAAPELVALARRNVALRPNAEAKLLLAQAYLKSSQPAPARAIIAEIATTPWRTPELARLQRELAAR
ncbi:MAG TPA: hypothetical protein VEK57_31110 [Thermoanaerobaculia bacterium]|nr:hypothetical protein [Thermoanaerobaculia bacterium]